MAKYEVKPVNNLWALLTDGYTYDMYTTEQQAIDACKELKEDDEFDDFVSDALDNVEIAYEQALADIKAKFPTREERHVAADVRQAFAERMS